MWNLGEPEPSCGPFVEHDPPLLHDFVAVVGFATSCTPHRDPFAEPLWNLEPFKCGTFMRNLGEPGANFPTAAPNHPEALLSRPLAFQAVGGIKSFSKI